MLKPICNELDDAKWLTGNEAGAILSELSGKAAPIHQLTEQLRRRLSPTQTHAVLEQVELRRRAAAKFSQPERMFFTRKGLEQATDEWVARYKASRIARVLDEAAVEPDVVGCPTCPPPSGAKQDFTSGREVGAASRAARSEKVDAKLETPCLARLVGSTFPLRVVDFCCGIGGDLLALAQIMHGSVFVRGVDRDPVASHFASINSGVPVHSFDVADFDFDRDTAWHLDPDRRPAGPRTTRPDQFEPNLATIESLLARSRHAAVKLAPATTPPAGWAESCELEWISRDHECKQLVAWHGKLACKPGRRRATVLTRAGTQVRSVVGDANVFVPIASRLQEYLFDVDPAVIAARLTGALSAEHELSALATGPTYLTGNQPITQDLALACFRVEDVLPLHVKQIAAYLRERSIGRLEIKKRGVEIDPENLRRALKLRGTEETTILVTKITEKAVAVHARRIRR
ncbi:MAG: hypothetical protein IT425_06830 [Pirellulales bacterium]|nr:hypothetical protein [Pirellulales bacterium]